MVYIFQVSDKTVYLGANVVMGMKGTTTTIMGVIENKMNKILGATSKERSKLTLKAEQVYVEGWFSFNTTAAVVAGLLTIQDGLRMWEKIQRKFMNVPIAISNHLMMDMLP